MLQTEKEVATLNRTQIFTSIKENCSTVDNSSIIKLLPVDNKYVKQDLSHRQHLRQLSVET